MVFPAPVFLARFAWRWAVLSALVMPLACSKTSSSGGGGPAAATVSAAPITHSLKYYNHFPFNNVYTLPVELGGQSVEAVLDTGSSNMLAIGNATYCPGCVNEYGYTSTYTPGSSSQALQTQWSISFLPIGEAQVQGYSDTFSFGGIAVPNYPFGVVTAEQGIPNIWGIAYRASASPSDSPQQPPFDAIAAAAGLANEFSLTLCALRSGSSITMGGYDKNVTSHMSQVQWTHVLSAGSPRTSYYIPMNRMYIPGTGTATAPQWVWTASSGEQPIVDSGTNPIVIPASVLTPLVSLLTATAASNGISIPASFWPTTTAPGGFAALTAAEVAKFPPIMVDVANFTSGEPAFTLTIQPSVYFQTREDGERFLGIEAGSETYILGTVFMENYLVLFDRGSTDWTVVNDPTARVGFYPNTGLCN